MKMFCRYDYSPLQLTLSKGDYMVDNLGGPYSIGSWKALRTTEASWWSLKFCPCKEFQPALPDGVLSRFCFCPASRHNHISQSTSSLSLVEKYTSQQRHFGITFDFGWTSKYFLWINVLNTVLIKASSDEIIIVQNWKRNWK